jgi:hypothetical protein
MTSGGIPVRDLKAVLSVVKAALQNPAATIDRILQLCERSEAATAEFRAEQAELACLRAEHARHIAQTRQESSEQIARERDAWDRELAQRQAEVEGMEREAMRRREWADKDRQLAAELRLKFERKCAPAHEALGEFASAVPADPELSV